MNPKNCPLCTDNVPFADERCTHKIDDLVKEIIQLKNVVRGLGEGFGLQFPMLAVRVFHHSFDHPTGEIPLSLDRAETRAMWMQEELNEFYQAATERSNVGQVDALIDLIYFAIGTLVEMGLTNEQAHKCFNVVHNANMAKLSEDGKPIYDSYGKVMKPAGWIAPETLIQKVLDGD